jgi:SAM-dependent methyltransferase
MSKGKMSIEDVKAEELSFWRWWLRQRGGWYHRQDYLQRVDPEAELQPVFLPWLRSGCTKILDVGAGPITNINKKAATPIEITAIDPLAEEYDVLLQEVGVVPLVRTVFGDGERLTETLPKGKLFDITYSHNALDHACDPMAVIRQMLVVTRTGGAVISQVYEDEAKRRGGKGMHKWNFSLSGNTLMLGLHKGAKFDVMSILVGYGAELVQATRQGTWLTVVIRKTGE